MTQQEDRWVSEVRSTLQTADTNFFQISPLRFWADFLLSLVLAYTAGSFFLMSPLFSWQQFVAFPFTVFWLYRLSSLVHEVAHLPHREMRLFKVAWNLAVGVITLSPSPFFTRHHRDHHSARMYGTPEDPEYIANVFRAGSLMSGIAYAVLIAAFPLIVFVRFLLTPLTFLTPGLRDWALRRASSTTMNWRYERKVSVFDRHAITAIELLCCLRAWVIPLCVVFGITDWTRLPLLYLVAISTLGLNQLRFLGDHHLHSDGRPLSMSAHILDSCNYTSRDLMTSLLFPFSIRYHALHHLFPTIPYHNLAATHSWLVAHLPQESNYHTLDQGSWWNVVRGLSRMRVVRVEAVVPEA